MDLRGYIDVTEIDPRLLVQVAYSGSRPQGLGFLHARPGGLDEATLNAIMEDAEKSFPRPGEINLDYLHGRSMKFHVRVVDERKYIDLDWYDHGREATKHLVRECGLPDVEAKISKAEAEKAEQAREWQAKQARAARAFVKLVADRGGRILRTEEPIKNYYLLPENDPVGEAVSYGREPAIKAGWISTDETWSQYSLTPLGRAQIGA
jgi:hypothetical protein